MYHTFFELEAPISAVQGEVRRVHCLIELQHRVATDARLGWLQAMVLAGEVLKRMPCEKELRPIPAAAAKALMQAAHLPGTGSNRVVTLADNPAC